MNIRSALLNRHTKRKDGCLLAQEGHCDKVMFKTSTQGTRRCNSFKKKDYRENGQKDPEAF